LDRGIPEGTKLSVRDEKVKELSSKIWDFHEKELSGKGYTHQEILIAWDSVSFAQMIKSAKKPENASLLKIIRELLE
jgi:hypothetical protein